jgi:hypothetical protein
VNFSAIDPVLIRYSACVRYWRRNGSTVVLYISYLNTSRKPNDLVGQEVLYNIFIEFAILLKLIGLIKVCLNETFSTVLVDKLLSDAFHIQNGLKQGNTLLPLLFVSVEYAISKVKENRGVRIEWDTLASGLCC